MAKEKIVWIEVEAQFGGAGSEWIKGKITDPPVVQEVNAEKAAKYEATFRRPFPTGRYVQVLHFYNLTRHFVWEGSIRLPEEQKKKRLKEIPTQLQEFAGKLQEAAAQAKEEKALKDATKGLSSKPPPHILAKMKKKQRKTR